MVGGPDNTAAAVAVVTAAAVTPAATLPPNESEANFALTASIKPLRPVFAAPSAAAAAAVPTADMPPASSFASVGRPHGSALAQKQRQKRHRIQFDTVFALQAHNAIADFISCSGKAAFYRTVLHPSDAAISATLISRK